MTVFAAQYLESLPEGVTPARVRRRLRQAFERLPISLILAGWELPPNIEEAIAAETARQGARLVRWQPWLTADAHTDLPPEWRTTSLDGTPIAGYNSAPDFTFVCPNHAGVADFLSERLDGIASRGVYQGLFLDRIRFPSPAPDPGKHLGCFCRQCSRMAAETGLDLEQSRRHIKALLADADGAQRLVRSLLGKPGDPSNPLEAFLDFRLHSITRTVEAARRQARASGLELGLDCFSPVLTRMVGQDLAALDKASDWIKIMVYPRIFEPAGISFELLALADWLMRSYQRSEVQALACLQEASGLPIPPGRAEWVHSGLGSETVSLEIRRARMTGVANLLAGLALVKKKGIQAFTPQQIRGDLQASLAADGLVISWDLWYTPLEVLDIIRDAWK